MKNHPAEEYVKHGFVLVPFMRGKKGPGDSSEDKGWNRRERCIATPEQAAKLNGGNIGLAHAYARTCAIDLDDVQACTKWFSEHNIDIVALLRRDDAVRITSGRPNRAKLLYRLPDGIEPLPTKKLGEVGLELRCATSKGLTVQDVLPPSIHPDTGKPYEWRGDWRKLPVLPKAVLDLWRQVGGATRGSGNTQAPTEATTITAGRRNTHLTSLGGSMRRRDMSAAAIKAALLTENAERCTPPLPEDEVRRIAQSVASYEPNVQAGELVLDRGDPLATARTFIETRYRDNERQLLIYYFGGDFYVWRGSHYSPEPSESLRAALYAFLETAQIMTDDGPEPYRPTARRVNDVLDALRAATELHTASGLPPDPRRAPPFWLGGGERPDADNLLPCANGLLDLKTRKLQPHTPNLFNTFALPYAYNQRAPKPERWLRFLSELWPRDPESRAALQEIFALALVADTSHQKIFLIVGPKRAGKGAIARTLTSMLGAGNVINPTLDSITRNFGLAPLIGKTLAIISDARLGDRADQKIVAERLLSISGEDAMTIDRKHRAAWTGRLPVRFLLLTNELPRIADTSGALASRFIVLRLTESFYGREDHGLDRKLQVELPGVLNWALDGLAHLRERGHFVQPKSARESIEMLQDLTSPMGAFLRDRCTVGPQHSIETDQLYRAYCDWCGETGRHNVSRETFGRDLHAALPELRSAFHRTSDGRVRLYQGVGGGGTGGTCAKPLQHQLFRGKKQCIQK